MLTSLVSSGCGTLRDGRAWGQDVTLLPGWSKVGEAAWDAASDPWTWVPVAGAALFAIDDWDEEVSDWAMEETPIFGSNENAVDASDILRGVSIGGALASSLAAASGPSADVWVPSKAKALGIQALGFLATDKIVADLKGVTGRDRPNGEPRSMPSTHAAQAFASAAWTVPTLDSVDMSDRARRPLKIAARTLAIGTAWARVEGEKHYPSDVLVGAAIGNFLTRFTHDAFMGLPGDPILSASVDPGGDGFAIGISWGF